MPGQHGPVLRTKLSEYGRQLREKQKIKKIFGLSEGALRKLYAEAERRSGNSAENLVKLIESRLDNLVYRAGIGASRSDSRQIVSHEHVKVNDRKLSIPSAIIKPGQKISFAKDIKIDAKNSRVSSWLKYDEKTKSFEYLRMPTREEIDLNINENLVVEYYSR